MGEKDALMETVIIPELTANDLYKPSTLIVSPEEFEAVYQFEFNTDSQVYTEGLSGYNGSGFISLSNKEYTSISVTVPTSQHYRIGLRMCGTGAKAAVMTGGGSDLSGSVVYGAVYSGDDSLFDTYWLDAVYLNKGENVITVQVLSGTAYLDEIALENAESVPKLAYSVSNSCVSPGASDNTKTVKRYLADIYGNRVLTAQFCSSGTDTEINAVYMSTGRYSALRCADIGIFTEYYDGYDKNDEYETDTAINWWKRGGLVSYSWYWQSPQKENSSCYTELTDFDIRNAVTENDIAELNPASLEAYQQTGRISSECLALIKDIDLVAVRLKLLDEQGVPVLFRPMPEAGNGWYWWGRDKDAYLWLYDLMFRRLNNYHGLTNLLWVWDGESFDYYPGDDKADIVGMDMYSGYDISGNARMKDAIGYTIKSKPTALTECGKIPNPDYIVRDNAYWLWTALWKGDYIINSNGSISYTHVSAQELDYAYNNELYLTLDELPDFSRY